jgi:hypothetical protein
MLCGLLLAAGFGVAAGALKGNNVGLRADIGNLSAPWLLVAFLPALRCRSAGRGALLGLVSTLLALAVFYLTLSAILMGHLGGHGYIGDLLVEIRANRIYLVAGMVTGPLLGVLGAWVGRRHPARAWLVAGGFTAGEIVVVALVRGRQLLPAPLYFKWGVDNWTPYVAECACGAVVIIAAGLRNGWWRRADAVATTGAVPVRRRRTPRGARR